MAGAVQIELSGRSAVVAGSSQAIAPELAGAGARVGVNGRSPGMTARGWGRVLNIGSDSAVVIPVEMIHDGVSKAALLAASRGFAEEAAGTVVTVTPFSPGRREPAASRTSSAPWSATSCPGTRRSGSSCAATAPSPLIQRLIEPEEIAHMVTYLASPLASATTGGALRIDGGYVDGILP